MIFLWPDKLLKNLPKKKKKFLQISLVVKKLNLRDETKVRNRVSWDNCLILNTKKCLIDQLVGSLTYRIDL